MKRSGYAQPARPEPPESWGVKRNAEVVLRVLRGEALDTISRQTGGGA